LVSRVVTDGLYFENTDELPFGVQEWYPAQMGTANRFLSIDGQSRERLVVVPAQFRATTTTTPTLGVLRRYTNLEFEVYHAPYTATDFSAPTIWDVIAVQADDGVTFRVQVEDDSYVVSRVVVLYREAGDNTWSKVELIYNPNTGWAEATVAGLGDTDIYYFAQAVDATGNVALAMDHGLAYTGVNTDHFVYLPLIVRE
jgi:hypothetical protein